MTISDIQFFTPQDNAVNTQSLTKAKAPLLTGYISATGKLVLPFKTTEQLGLDANTSAFRVGTDAGKRKIKTLYLVSADDSVTDAFTMEKGAKSYYIELGALLKRNGVDLSTTKYSFTIEPFEYQGGLTGYVLKLSTEAGKEPTQPKAPYMGKPRGRKKKEVSMP